MINPIYSYTKNGRQTDVYLCITPHCNGEVPIATISGVCAKCKAAYFFTYSAGGLRLETLALSANTGQLGKVVFANNAGG